LQKIWSFETWKNIYPEYYTEENRYWHSHNAKANSLEIASKNQRKFSVEEVKQMRLEYQHGKSPKQIWLQHAPKVSWSTAYNMITNKTYKDIK